MEKFHISEQQVTLLAFYAQACCLPEVLSAGGRYPQGTPKPGSTLAAVLIQSLWVGPSDSSVFENSSGDSSEQPRLRTAAQP